VVVEAIVYPDPGLVIVTETTVPDCAPVPRTATAVAPDPFPEIVIIGGVVYPLPPFVIGIEVIAPFVITGVPNVAATVGGLLVLLVFDPAGGDEGPETDGGFPDELVGPVGAFGADGPLFLGKLLVV
jgi:hypothetical protein